MREQNETNSAEPPEGAAPGSVLPFSTKGVDFVMTAMFVLSDRTYQN